MKKWIVQVIPVVLSLVIGGLLVFAYIDFRIGLWPPEAEGQINPSEFSEIDRERGLGACRDLVPQLSLDCLRQALEEEEDARPDNSIGLVFQYSISRWNFWMMISSFLSLFVTAIGVVYVARTLDQTVAANRAASSTADAAHTMNRIASEVSINERRPWLRVTTEIESDLYFMRGRYLLHLKISVANVGESPALGVFPVTKATSNKAAPFEIIQDVAKAERDGYVRVDGMSRAIFPGETRVETLTISKSKSDIAGTGALDKWGRHNFAMEYIALVSYRNAFDDRIHQTAALSMVVRTDGGHFVDDERPVAQSVLKAIDHPTGGLAS